MRVVRDAFEYRPDLVFLDGGLIDCGLAGLNDLLTGILAGRLQSLLPGILARLTENLDVNIPRGDLGITYNEMALCGRTDPDTGELFGSAAMCSDATPRFYGGRRHRCVAFDSTRERVDADEPVAEYRCARLHVETRRINLRPDGIEIVFADSTADPQHPLLSVVHPDLCDADRPGSLLPDAIPQSRTMQRSAANLLTGPSPPFRRICHPDDPLTTDAAGDFVGCRGPCADIGIPCSIPVPGVPQRDGATSEDRCYVVPHEPHRAAGSCCTPAEFCPVPEAGGGRRFFGNATDPPQPSEFWRCTNPTRDEWACGGCAPPAGSGEVCASGDMCCDSGCRDIDTDPAHCGACGRACADGAPCVAGSCCGSGEVVCAGACTDLMTSSSHCGACGQPCAPGTHCSGGVCCGEGEAYCGGACIDVLSDPTNCGGCGEVCEGGQHCSDGTCCAAGADDCDGDGTCEVLSFNPDHCGYCGNACSAFEICYLGSCA